jgi:hypothetical protein
LLKAADAGVSAARSPKPRGAGPVRGKGPDQRRQAAVLLDRRHGAPGVVDRRFDLPPVPDDGGIGQHLSDLAFAETGHLLRVEPGEMLAEGFQLAKHRDPREPRLETLQGDLFEQGGVSLLGVTPLRVVVADVERVLPRPATAPHPVPADDHVAHGSKSSAAELMQYRRPVGPGPSVNT